MKVLLDVSSYAWRCLLAGQDKENGYYETHPTTGEQRYINSAQYGLDNLAGCLKSVCQQLGFAPKDLILVLDGVGGKQLRTQFHAEYKAGRDKSPAMYTEYNQLEQWFCQQMLGLGAQVVSHKGVEADDLIGWFCETLHEDKVLVLSHDKDLLVCAKYPHVAVYIQEQINPKLFGEFPFEYIDVYKATVGDSSDNIQGAKGFGPKAFEAVYAAFGDNGLAVLRKLIQVRRLKDLEEDVAKVPQLQKLIDYAESVERSLKCATLYPEYIQMDKLEWQHGVNRADAEIHPHLVHFQQKVVGVTKHNFSQVYEDIVQHVQNTSAVVLDIETTTSYESDEWLFDIRQEESKSVDVFGSELTGLGLTLGDNFQYTYYFAINHADTDNCSLLDVETLLMHINRHHRFVIHNTNFELVVLHNTFGWFLRDVDDTKLMASYVDENNSLGLKPNSKRWLNYVQTSYEETVGERKMSDLTLSEVLTYGTDDTICTAGLYQWYQLHMMLENVWNVYRNVEIGAAYWVAQAFLDGVNIDHIALRGMIERDSSAKAEQMSLLNEFLVSNGWEGTQFQAATDETRYDPMWIKYAFHIVEGKELDTRVRKFDRILSAIAEQETDSSLRLLLEHGDLDQLNTFVKTHFKGEPQFNIGSPKQVQHLLYDVMQLPIRLRNKPTDAMRAKGLEGTPQTDDLAIKSALHYDITEPDDPRRQTLNALLKVKTYSTREGLYYKTYPKLPHWIDKKIHAGLNQCSTVTRRFSSNNPKYIGL